MAEAKLSEIQSIFEEVVRSRLEGVEIDSVRVRESEDFEGDPILEVLVIFEAESGLKAATIATMLRHARSELIERLNETRFPIMSYVSKREAKKLGIEVE